ncbi:MAG TPA: hypothetical protein VFJ14_17190 [Nocardioidaceae bacterium]|nr:hypothetical protein [Nocardioidaceae bacterium]
MARRVLLHVGCPKTGTSFLQGVLWGSRDALAEQGLVVPLSYNHHYRASLFVRENWQQRTAAEGIESAWRQLQRAVQEAEHDVVISHETLAAATESQASRAIEAFGGAETHVVVTARDLARQLPAEWQQSVKQGSVHRLDDFVHDVVHRGPRANWFWRVQDLPDIVQRWGATLPPDRVHVVTVPPKGADPSALWTRFASVLGVDPDSCDLHRTRSNESLGSVEVELLRRINESRDDRFPIRANHRWFKNLLANEILAQRPGKDRFAVAEETHEWVCDTARRMVEMLREQGCDVVGDLDDLLPPPVADVGANPGQVSDAALLQSAIDTVLDLLDEHRGRVERLERWRGVAVSRGRQVAELEARQQRFGRPEWLEWPRLGARARAALGRIRRGIGPRGG